MEPLASTCLPDVQPNTRILALCGITDTMTPNEKDLASPKEDGWLFSDFFLFNHLLKGAGSYQAWFTCEEPRDLVAKYGAYLHGNPFKERVIVLDNEKLEGSDAPHDIVVAPRDQLLQAFLLQLEVQCGIARREKQPVLIFIFGHGEPLTYNVEVGWSIPKQDAPLLTIKDFKRATGSGIDVCTVMTPCFSGGWTITPSLNFTAMTAAEQEDESGSLNASQSIGRKCGSIYATAAVEALTREEELPEDLSSLPKEQLKSYREFTSSVESTLLLDVDRFGNDHNISFSAQDDKWEMEWKKRTGIPLNNFHQRYLALKTVPADVLLSSFANRDPNMPRPSDERREMENYMLSQELPNFSDNPFGEEFTCACVRGRFGSARGLQRSLKPQARFYMASYPGRDTLANNGKIHRLATECIQGKPLSNGDIMMLYCALDYRLSQINAATQHLKMLKVEFPVPCHMWDEMQWKLDHVNEDKTRFHEIARELHGVFVRPNRFQGRDYSKPRHYLATALAASRLSDAEIQEKITELKAFVASTIIAHTSTVMKDDNVKFKKRSLLRAFGRIS